MKKNLPISVALVSAAVGGVCPPPALAQSKSLVMLEEVIVTARRRDEIVQDVPISMTVFNQEQIDDRNILSAADLAVYTPSMSANPRFGGDFASFSIRGFSQELRTTASVGVYFAEVVAPRGANTTTSGDGAGPGDLFDLENVQVLKGPQGTLFGRNTTGGAVLIVPKRPTDELEGYVEGSVGNYNMTRLQGVLNLPMGDRIRARFGVDYQNRDGYIENLISTGPDDFADVDYVAGRASLTIDITDNLENYTILKGVDSENNGYPGQTFACNPESPGLSVFYSGACFEMLESDPRATDYYYTFNTHPDAVNKLEQWQVINHLTWEISDNLTVRNILSYGQLETFNDSNTFGTNIQFPIPPFDNILPDIPAGGLGAQEFNLAGSGTSNTYATTDQESYVVELQVLGTSFDDRLTWQAGLYYEKSEPENPMGARSAGYNSCDQSTLRGDPSEFRCNDLLAVFLPFETWGFVQEQPYGITYENQAAYGQATYEFTDVFSVTAGLRYTSDETDGFIDSTIYRFPSNPFTGGYFPVSFTQFQRLEANTKSDEPTWLLGLDFTPTEDILLYAKYSRGYRQGGLNIAAPEGLQTYGPEEVDAYEIGAKTTFHGTFPGTFNIAAFYNDLAEQQIQVGLLPAGRAGTTSIGNIGKSTIQGVEVEGSIYLLDSLLLSASYAYLDTEVESFLDPAIDPRYDDFRASGGIVSSAQAVEGDPLPFAPEHSLTVSANYRLPIAEELGEVHALVSYIYQDDMQVTSPSFTPYGVLPSYELLNLNLNWNSVLSSPIDVSIFATNVLDEEYLNFVGGGWGSFGFETRYVGQPRMYGMRLRFSF